MRGGTLAQTLGRIRRVTLLVLVAGLPLVFLWEVVNVPFEVPKLVLLVVCTSVAGAARLGEIALGASAAGLRRAAVPALLVAVPAVAAWAASPYRSWALLGMYGRFGGLVPILFTVAAGVLLADAFGGRLRLPAWALAGAAAGAALYAVVQAAGLDPFEIPVVEYVTSTVGHSNFLGGFVAIALPVTLGLVVSSRGIARYAALGAAILAALGLLLSFSQGGWIAAAAGVAAFVASTSTRRWARPAGWLVAAGLALAAVGIVVLSLVDPFHPAVPDTARARGLWWKAAVSMGAESPLLGRGPEVYAIEGPHHRTAADALAHDRTYADQPHSVPLAYLANHGVPGLAGFLVLMAWTLRKAWRAAGDPLLSGFGAGAVAYLTQSLVSIDVLVVAVPFWLCVGALATSGAREPEASERERDPGPVRTAFALLFVAAAGVAVAWSVSFLATDARARDAVAAFEERRTAGAFEAFEDVLRRRDNEGYRHLYGSLLGAAALRERREGIEEIERMTEVFAFVDDFPDVRMLTSYADGLHQWAVFDETLEVVALERFEQALELDEHSPTLRVLAAEAHMTQGSADLAIEVLEDMLPVFAEHPEYTHNQPQVYGALATAYFLEGREAEARETLDRAVELAAGAPDQCIVMVARELLRTGGATSTRDEYVDSSPSLLLCKPATLSLLPGYDPEEKD